MSVNNYNGRLTGKVKKNDRISLWINTASLIDKAEENPDLRPAAQYGTAAYGESSYGQYNEPLFEERPTHRWTGLIDEPENQHNGGLQYSLSINAGDYVFSILNQRRHTYPYEDRPISGSPDAILNRALRAEAPEIDRSQIQSLGASTDITWRRRTLLDLLKRCVKQGDAVATADDTALVFRPADDVSPQFEITHTSGDWYGGMSVSHPTEEFYNRLLLVGGTEPVIDDSQSTVDTTATLSAGASGRREIQISPKGDRIDSVGVYTAPSTDAEGAIQGDGIVARIQRGDGSGPVAPGDKQSDIASGQVDASDLTAGGWTRISVSDGIVSRDTAWLILQTRAGGDQTIGVRTNSDDTNTPAYRTYYPYDVAVDRSNPESIAEFGRVDHAMAQDTLETGDEAGDRAEALVESAAQIPTVIDGVVARSERMHSLRPVDLVDVNAPRLTDHSGTYVVTERTTALQGTELSTEFTLQHLDTL